MTDSDLLHGYLILLYIFIGMFSLLLMIFLCKRCKSVDQSNFLRDLGREFGYRDNSFRDSSSSQTSLWRATSSWNSKPYNYVRHSTSSTDGGIPTIIVTENRQWSTTPSGPSEQPVKLSSTWVIPKPKKGSTSAGFLLVPLDVIEEEEVANLPPEMYTNNPSRSQQNQIPIIMSENENQSQSQLKTH